MKIALDAMGGDFAPEQIVAGGVQAHRELGVEVVFVGIKEKVDAALAASGAGKWAEIQDAPDVIAMDEHPAQAVRSKKASSIDSIYACNCNCLATSCAAACMADVRSAPRATKRACNRAMSIPAGEDAVTCSAR